MDDIYLDRPNLYIGFHGCEKRVGMDLILNPNHIHYSEFIGDLKKTGTPIPQNTDLKGRPDPNGILRFLDCFLIEHLHSVRDITEDIPYFDTVRGAFTEGMSAYPGTQFGDKNHIQVCIRNKKCIKGFFLPRC